MSVPPKDLVAATPSLPAGIRLALLGAAINVIAAQVSPSATFATFRGAQLREPIVVSRNQPPVIAPQVELNLLRCAIEGCNETFWPTEFLHTGASFVCKKHPRTEQFRAVGRSYDKKKDHPDEKAEFQRGQFDDRTRSAHSWKEDSTRPFKLKPCHTELRERQFEIISDAYDLPVADVLEVDRFVKNYPDAPDEEDDPGIFKASYENPAASIVEVDADAYDKEEKAAWGRPITMAEKRRTSVGVDVDRLSGTYSQKSQNKRVKAARETKFEIPDALIEALQKAPNFPEFIVKSDILEMLPRPLHGNSISGNKRSHELVPGATKSTPRKTILLTFGASDRSLDAYDDKIDPEVRIAEVFETLKETTSGNAAQELRDHIDAVEKCIEAGKMRGSVHNRYEHPANREERYSKRTGRIVRFHKNDPAFVEAALQMEQILGNMTHEEVGQKMKELKNNCKSTTQDATRMRQRRLTEELKKAVRTASEEFMAGISEEDLDAWRDKGGIFLLVRRNRPKVYRLSDFKITHNGKPAFDREVAVVVIEYAYTRLMVDRAEKAGRKAVEGVTDQDDRKREYNRAFLETIEAFESAEWYVLQPLKTALNATGPWVAAIT